MAPRLAAHENAIYLHAALFERIAALHDRREELGLDDEGLRLLERIAPGLRAGRRPAGGRRRDSAIAKSRRRLADLTTRFAQNLLADEAGWVLQLQGEADLAGLPEFVRSAARSAAPAARPGPAGPRHHLVALAGRAVPDLLGAARPARGGLARAHRARRPCRRARQPADRGPDHRAAPGAGGAARLRQLCRLRAGRPHGERYRCGAGPAGQGLGAGQAQGRRGPRAAHGHGAAPGRAHADRRLGLALPGREGAPASSSTWTTRSSSLTSPWTT